MVAEENRRKWLLAGQAGPDKWDAPEGSVHGHCSQTSSLSSALLLQLL